MTFDDDSFKLDYEKRKTKWLRIFLIIMASIMFVCGFVWLVVQFFRKKSKAKK